MKPCRSNLFLKLSLAVILVALANVLSAAAQDLTPGLTYVCNGERLYIDSCNIRDTSDNGMCMIGHPDHVNPNGIMQYTNMTRADMKKLFPSCQQPTPQQLAAAKARQQRQQAQYDAAMQKANQPAPTISSQSLALPGQPTPPKNAEERELRRCVSSGRPASNCTGNSLLGAFTSMISSVLPTAGEQQAFAGPVMSGVFQGAGSWRLDFVDGGVLVNCSFLSPNQETYTVTFKPTGAVLTIATTPKPLVLSVRGDGTIVGPPGQVVIDGVVPGGYTPGTSTAGHTETSSTTSHQTVSSTQAGAYAPSQLTYQGNGNYDAATTTTSSTYVPGTSTPGYTDFVSKRATCPAINLSSKGTGPGIQTMQTDLLKSMLGGDKGPPVPPGIRMHGIFATASTGFSLEFFPESVILGCGPDAARAYPYTVESGSSGAAIKIAATDHPLTVAIKSDGSLDPGSTSPYQVHGRIVTGQDNDDNFTFAPMEQTCNLAVLAPAKAIPSSGGTAATMVASAAAPANGGGTLSVPGATLGNATLSIVSGFPPQPGMPNPLANHPYTLLRDSLQNIITKTGVTIPPGSTPYKVLGIACGTNSPDCPKILNAVKANAASAVRADANGTGTFPGVAPGTYYLMISTQLKSQALVWTLPVQLKSGANSITLSQSNATPLN